MSDFPDFVMQLLLVVCISIGVSEYVFLALGLFTMAVFVFLGRDAEIAFPPEICYDEPIIQ